MTSLHRPFHRALWLLAAALAIGFVSWACRAPEKAAAAVAHAYRAARTAVDRLFAGLVATMPKPPRLPARDTGAVELASAKLYFQRQVKREQPRTLPGWRFAPSI